MFNKKTLFGALGVILVAALIFAFKPDQDKQMTQTIKSGTGNSFAVVELFTSEGCSSCPPADQLLGRIIKKARAKNKRVFGLAFHVDYWDDLGWKDIYSSAAYTRRQQDYARTMNSNSVYTPEMVVNGKVGFVGSNSSRARSRIQHALNKPAEVSVNLNTIAMEGNHNIKIGYKVNKIPSDAVINLAVVERGVVRHVKRGENSGLTMHHQNVVRAFNIKNLKNASGTATLKLPDGVDLNKTTVVAYVQNKNSMHILGAQGKDLHAGKTQP